MYLIISLLLFLLSLLLLFLPLGSGFGSGVAAQLVVWIIAIVFLNLVIATAITLRRRRSPLLKALLGLEGTAVLLAVLFISDAWLERNIEFLSVSQWVSYGPVGSVKRSLIRISAQDPSSTEDAPAPEVHAPFAIFPELQDNFQFVVKLDALDSWHAYVEISDISTPASPTRIVLPSSFQIFSDGDYTTTIENGTVWFFPFEESDGPGSGAAQFQLTLGANTEQGCALLSLHSVGESGVMSTAFALITSDERGAQWKISWSAFTPGDTPSNVRFGIDDTGQEYLEVTGAVIDDATGESIPADGIRLYPRKGPTLNRRHR